MINNDPILTFILWIAILIIIYLFLYVIIKSAVYSALKKFHKEMENTTAKRVRDVMLHAVYDHENKNA